MSAKTVATVCFTALGVATLVFVAIKCRAAISVTLAAALAAIALDRPTRWLERHHVRRWLAIVFVVTSTIVLVVGALLLVVPPAVDQTRVLVHNGPTIMANVRSTRVYRAIDARIDVDEKWVRLRQASPGLAEQAVDPVLRAARSVIRGAAAVATVFFLSIFMLLFGRRLLGEILEHARPERVVLYERVIRRLYQSVGAYLAGLVLICSVNAVCTTLFLAIVRIPFFLPLGILAGISSLIPVAGNLVMGIVLVAVALLAGGLWKAVVVTLYALAYQQFENHILGPLVYKRTVAMNPLLVIVSLLFFSELGGIAGAIIALPAVACAKVVLREVLAVRRARQADHAAVAGDTDGENSSPPHGWAPPVRH